MSLLPDEKELISRALQLYAQMIGQQYGPTEMQALVPLIKEILAKLDDVGASAAAGPGKLPFGISQEWYDAVCATCPKVGGPSGCQDPVTVKFPGKCDPILTWERKKILKA